MMRHWNVWIAVGMVASGLGLRAEPVVNEEFVRRPLGQVLGTLAERALASLPCDPHRLAWPVNGLISGVPASEALAWALDTFPVRGELRPEEAAAPAPPERPGWPAAPGDRESALWQKLHGRRVDMQFDRTPLRDAIGQLERLLGVPLELHESAAARIRGDPVVKLEVTGISGRALLQWICRISGLEYHVSGDRVILAAPGQFAPDAIPGRYDLDWVVGRPATFPGITFSLLQESDASSPPADYPAQIHRFVSEYLIQTQPVGAQPARAVLNGRSLLVTAPVRAQQQVRDFLGQFPAYQAMSRVDGPLRSRVSWYLRNAPLPAIAEHVTGLTRLPVIMTPPSLAGRACPFLDLRDVELWEAFRLVAESAGAELRVEGTGVLRLAGAEFPGAPQGNAEPHPSATEWHETPGDSLERVIESLGRKAELKVSVLGPKGTPPQKIALASNTPPRETIEWLLRRVSMPYRVEESQIVVGSDDAQAAQPAVGWEETMDRGLRQEVTFDFQGTAFSDAIAFLRKESGVNIIVDSAALRMIARGGDLPIHAKAEKIPVRDALHRILKPIPLNWQVLDEAVYVSQVEREAAAPELRFYSISDMGGWPEEFPGIRFTLRSDGGLRTPEQFITFLQESLPPVMKDKPLSLWPAWTRCAVVCPATVHEPIAAALRQVREFEMLQRLRPRLAQPVSLCLRNAPLERVLGFFRRVTGLNFAVPSPAPSEGLPGVTVEIFGAPAWEGLKYAALSCGLSCELTGSGIVIMRPAKVAGNVPAATGVLEIVPGSFGGFGFPVLP